MLRIAQKRAPFGRSTCGYSIEARPGFEPGIRKIFSNVTTASAKVFTLSFQPAFYNLVELLLGGYRFLQIHFFPFNRFHPLGRLRVALPLLRGRYRFSATVAYMKYEKATFQWLKSTKLGIMINRDTRPILLDVDLRGYF